MLTAASALRSFQFIPLGRITYYVLLQRGCRLRNAPRLACFLFRPPMPCFWMIISSACAPSAPSIRRRGPSSVSQSSQLHTSFTRLLCCLSSPQRLRGFRLTVAHSASHPTHHVCDCGDARCTLPPPPPPMRPIWATKQIQSRALSWRRGERGLHLSQWQTAQLHACVSREQLRSLEG